MFGVWGGVDRRDGGDARWGEAGRQAVARLRAPVTAGAGLPPIRAAGGLVVRGEDIHQAEVAVVHRPRYDDWTLPKGKEEPGEAPAECALREVHEETGLRARIVGHAGTARYPVAGTPKQVEYYLMRPYRVQGFRPDSEVDEMRWSSLAEAVTLLTYDFDRTLLAEVNLQGALSFSDLHLVRHAAAGDRRQWEAPDHLRPLTPRGERQAKALAAEVGGVGVSRILSSPYVRCVQTVQPLSESTGIEIEMTESLAEGAGPGEISALLEEVAGTTAVLCSHGDVIPAMLSRLQWTGVDFLSPAECKKGSTWVVGHDGLGFDQARYLPPPD